MMIEITVQPAPTVSRFETSLVLESRRWTFVFYTNTQDDSWSMDLIGDDQLPRVRGLGLSTGVDMLHPYRALDVPPGALFINDIEGTGRDPTISSFADEEAALYYLTSDSEALA